MNKFNKCAARLLLLSSCVSIASVETVEAAGCQVLSKSTLESKADRFGKTIRSAAHKYGVHEDLVKAVITVESCFRASAHGSSGEKGLMQLMPSTARRFSVRRGYNPWQNIHGGTRYLSYLLKRYNGDAHHAVAAYNAGEGNVHLGGRIRNGDYVSKVMRAYSKFSYGDSSQHVSKVSMSEQGSSPVISQKTRHAGLSEKEVRDVTTAATVVAVTQPVVRGHVQAVAPSDFKVKKGYTVYEVMRQTSVPVKQIIKLNGLKAPYHLQFGQQLKLR